MWWHYVVGYGFSILAGHVMIRYVMDELWDPIPTDYKTRKELPQMIGAIERTLYTSAWITGHAEFFGIWLVLKVAGVWEAWGKGTREKDEVNMGGRPLYNIFLIGTAFSIAYGVVGALMIDWLENDSYVDIGGRHIATWIIVASVLILGTTIFWWWAKYSNSKSS